MPAKYPSTGWLHRLAKDGRSIELQRARHAAWYRCPQGSCLGSCPRSFLAFIGLPISGPADQAIRLSWQFYMKPPRRRSPGTLLGGAEVTLMESTLSHLKDSALGRSKLHSHRLRFAAQRDISGRPEDLRVHLKALPLWALRIKELCLWRHQIDVNWQVASLDRPQTRPMAPALGLPSHPTQTSALPTVRQSSSSATSALLLNRQVDNGASLNKLYMYLDICIFLENLGIFESNMIKCWPLYDGL